MRNHLSFLFLRTFSLLTLLIFLSVCSVSIKAQEDETVTFISIKSNLRGTPSNQGVVVTTVNKGDTGVVIKNEGAWYLIQTIKYVGWVHGNNIQIDSEYSGNEYTPTPTYVQPVKPKPLPPGTYIPQESSSPFSEEYVDADFPPTILVKNDSEKNLNLEVGGVTFAISKRSSKEIVLDPGAYKFTVSAPGVRSLSGTKQFNKGSRYSWTFFIVTKRV